MHKLLETDHNRSVFANMLVVSCARHLSILQEISHALIINHRNILRRFAVPKIELCELYIFEVKHKSTEHVFQYIKAVRNLDMLMSCKTRWCACHPSFGYEGQIQWAVGVHKGFRYGGNIENQVCQVPVFRDKFFFTFKHLSMYPSTESGALASTVTVPAIQNRNAGKRILGLLMKKSQTNTKKKQRRLW